MVRPSRWSTIVFLLLSVPFLQAATINLNFEGFPDGTNLTTQYPGLTFSNTQILTAGIGLNEFEFPPHSGTNVASDNGGPISILFATPTNTFSGDFTYTVPLTLKGFNGAGTQVASATSKFGNNLACLAGPPCSGQAGSSPNELLSVSSLSGISRVTITGDLAGGSFVLDDATITSSPSTAVPEPSTFLLSGSAFVLILSMYLNKS